MAEIIPFPRSIVRSWTVERQSQGPGHDVAMVLPPGKFTDHDPFLFLAEDWFQKGTFDTHPHRGFETVTYVIDGHLEHFDNQFGEGRLGPGDVQWMTAGRGVIHKEDAVAGETVHSLQLWVNLPRADKLTVPRYQNLLAKDMPVHSEPGVIVRIFSGQSGGLAAPTQNYVPVTMLDITMAPGYAFTTELPGDYSGFLYVLEGAGQFGENAVDGQQGQVLWLGSAGASDDSQIKLVSREALRVLLYAGRPLHEPVVAYGPFVMNTKAEIGQAIDDYHAGKFGG